MSFVASKMSRKNVLVTDALEKMNFMADNELAGLIDLSITLCDFSFVTFGIIITSNSTLKNRPIKGIACELF